MKVTLLFRKNIYERNFEKTEYPCPRCYEFSVWEEIEHNSTEGINAGFHLCIKCCAQFYFQGITNAKIGYKFVAEQLRSGKLKTPVFNEES